MAMVSRLGGAGLTKISVTANAAATMRTVGRTATQRSLRKYRRTRRSDGSDGMVGAEYRPARGVSAEQDLAHQRNGQRALRDEGVVELLQRGVLLLHVLARQVLDL